MPNNKGELRHVLFSLYLSKKSKTLVLFLDFYGSSSSGSNQRHYSGGSGNGGGNNDHRKVSNNSSTSRGKTEVRCLQNLYLSPFLIQFQPDGDFDHQ